MTLQRLGLLLVALSFGLVACGGTDSGTDTGSKASPRASASAPASSPSAAASTAASVAGKWIGTYISVPAGGAQGSFQMTFVLSGNQLSGPIHIAGSPCVKDGTITGTVTGDKISFGAVKTGQKISYEGALSSGALGGTWAASGCGAPVKGTWTATRP